ncbi:helix-turn-helix domain-containing protein [Ornithinibacillus californiensis]|uniref:helix-turn-helix domain-containing protein n=1 Tax=Ornithinibacillus californiensis TaxID=161536 RepID=UPI00064DD2B2|nr:RodZ domain-containing protein [Ornithinibacillus californiensis]
MGIGARLKEARVAKDISLDTLQDTTKIQKRYLVAIEEENFSILPGKFYAKAFIKEYAIAVGLDPNQLMEEYKQDIPSPEEDTTTQYTRIHRSRKDNMPTKSSAIFSFIPTLIVVILIIGIIFLAWWFITKSNEPDGESPTTEQNEEEFFRPDNQNSASGDEEENAEEQEVDDETEEPTDDAEEEDVTEEEPKLGITVLEKGTVASPTSELELTNVGEQLILDFGSTGQDVWIGIYDINGQSIFSGTVTQDKPVTVDVTGQKRIQLNLGYTPSLTMTINDVQLEFPIDPNERDQQYIWLNVAEANE